MPVTVNEFKLNPLDGSITTEYSDGSMVNGSLLPASTLTADDAARLRAGASIGPGGLAGLGDSITANGVNGGADLSAGVIGQLGPRNWLMWASLLSGGRLPYAGIAATGGFTTQQIIDTHLPTMLAAIRAGRVGTVAVLCGTNDIGASVPVSTITANLAYIYSQLRSAGAQVVACMLTPRESSPGVADIGANRAALSRVNAWIASRKNVLIADFHTPLVTAAGLWVSGMNGDNVHPATAGAKVMGQVLADVLAKTPTSTPWLAATSESTSGAGYSQIGNPLMTDTNADGTPDGVTASGATCSTNTTGTGLRGNYLRAAAQSAATGFVTVGNGVAAAVGDSLVFSARVRSAVESLSGSCDIGLWSAPSNATHIATLAAWDRDIPDGAVLSFVAQVPAKGTDPNVTLMLKARGAAGAYVEVAQVTGINATALALA
jgi:lysophospholipase L1-like esterase